MCDSMQSEQDLAAHADDLARAAELRKLVHAPAAAAENDALWQLHRPHATEAPFRASPRDETTAAELIQVRVPPAQLTEHLRHGRLLTRPPSNPPPPPPRPMCQALHYLPAAYRGSKWRGVIVIAVADSFSLEVSVDGEVRAGRERELGGKKVAGSIQ